MYHARPRQASREVRDEYPSGPSHHRLDGRQRGDEFAASFASAVELKPLLHTPPPQMVVLTFRHNRQILVKKQKRRSKGPVKWGGCDADFTTNAAEEFRRRRSGSEPRLDACA